MRASVLPAIAFATGCHLAFPIEPFDGDAGETGVGPRVFSSPGPAPEIWGGFASPVEITLASPDPGTTIYYTTDSSTPTEASPGGTTPVGPIRIEATSTVQYFGVLNGVAGEIVTEAFVISPASATSNAGYLVIHTTLDGTSPVVMSAAGATLAASADFQVWVQTGAGGYTAQVVYGVGEVAQGCLYTGVPNVHPGVTMMGKTFNVKVPSTRGLHEVRIAHIEETTCATALAAKPLSLDPMVGRPTQARIGAIIVR